MHVSHFPCYSGCFSFNGLHVLFKTDTHLTHVAACVVWVEMLEFFIYFFYCLTVRWFRKKHQKSTSFFHISYGMCAERHAYMHVIFTTLFLFIAQISRLMPANCGAIVLMLIEYSMWSFHKCLLVHFIWYCIKMSFSFPPSSFPNQISYWIGGCLEGHFLTSSVGLLCTEEDIVCYY